MQMHRNPSLSYYRTFLTQYIPKKNTICRYSIIGINQLINTHFEFFFQICVLIGTASKVFKKI